MEAWKICRAWTYLGRIHRGETLGRIASQENPPVTSFVISARIRRDGESLNDLVKAGFKAGADRSALARRVRALTGMHTATWRRLGRATRKDPQTKEGSK